MQFDGLSSDAVDILDRFLSCIVHSCTAFAPIFQMTYSSYSSAIKTVLPVAVNPLFFNSLFDEKSSLDNVLLTRCIKGEYWSLLVRTAQVER